MARILQNRYPIDSIDRKAVGFGFPINGPAVFVPTYTSREQTKSNIINCKINSIHINGIAVNKSESSNMLTICVTPTKNINKKKFKNGILRFHINNVA